WTPRRAHLLSRGHGDPDFSDRTVAWICDAGPLGAGRAHAVAHGAGPFGWRRIYEFDGVPGRTCARGPPRLNGCANRVWSGRGHPVRLRSWCGFCGQHVDRGVGILGLAHSLPARAHCGHCWLLSPPAYAREGTVRAAQTSSDRRDTARSLAHCYWICGLVGLDRRRLLCQLRLSRELAPNRRRHSAVSRTRNQFIQYGGQPTCRDRGRLIERQVRAQALAHGRMRARLCWCGTHFLAIEPALRAACTIWAAWPRPCHRALWRHIARLVCGSAAVSRAVQGG